MSSLATAAVRAVRPCRPSLPYAFCRCRSTVRTDSTSSAAISLLSLPRAASVEDVQLASRRAPRPRRPPSAACRGCRADPRPGSRSARPAAPARRVRRRARCGCRSPTPPVETRGDEQRGSGCARTRSSGRLGCAATRVGRSSSGRRCRESATGAATGPTRAVSASVAIRCSSSSQRICSSVAPGIISVVNTRRNSEVGRAQPTLIRAWKASSSSAAPPPMPRHRRRVAAVEGESGQPLRVPGGVLDRHRTALRHGQQREPVESCVVSDSLQVGDPGVEAVVGDAPVGQSVTSLVEPDHRGHLAELDQVVPPHRALPVELKVRRASTRRSAAVGRSRGSRTRCRPRPRTGRSGCPARCSLLDPVIAGW